jgi:hypothetical protein
MIGEVKELEKKPAHRLEKEPVAASHPEAIAP